MENKTVELVNLWHEFEKQHPGENVDDFCRYHLAMLEIKQQKSVTEPNKDFSNLPIETKLARSAGRLVRFHASYARKALVDLYLNNLDDFLYLNSLSRMKTPKKSELIYENISEFSSGTEIIRRLIKLGLVKEFPDAEDRRSKRLILTPKGKKVLLKCYNKMQELNFMVYRLLSPRDKELIYSMILRLDKLHTDVYSRTKNKSLEEIKEVFDDVRV
jgi:DNA-binding MarR family transcriptional regulator